MGQPTAVTNAVPTVRTPDESGATSPLLQPLVSLSITACPVIETLNLPVKQRLKEQDIDRTVLLQIRLRPVHPGLRGGHEFRPGDLHPLFDSSDETDQRLAALPEPRQMIYAPKTRPFNFGLRSCFFSCRLLGSPFLPLELCRLRQPRQEAVQALLLGGTGTYNLISYNVSRLIPEIGIRKALGATPGSVIWMMLKRACWMAVIGTALGLPLAFVTSTYLGNVLYGMKSPNLLAFGALPVILAGVVVFAGYLPSRWASKVDPMQALRSE